VIFWDVHESGRPDAPTVLLSSGLGGTASYWAPQLAALQARYRVIAYDQAGTGRNTRDLADDHSIAAMADEALAVLDATRTDQAHFVGHALGGLVGLDLATRHPQRLRSLTVVNGWAAAHAHTRRCFDLRLMLLKHEGPAAYVRAQPIFLYPADWLAKNAERAAQEEAHGLAGFQGADTLRRRIAALLAFDATRHLRCAARPDPDLRRTRRRAGALLDVGTTRCRDCACETRDRAMGCARAQRHAARRVQCVAARLSRLSLSYRRNSAHRAMQCARDQRYAMLTDAMTTT